MKKNTLYIISAVSLLALSCQKELDYYDVPNIAMDAPVLRATLAQGEAKASIGLDGKQSWNTNDSIGVFYSTFHHKYLFSGADGDIEGTFMPEALQNFVSATPLDVDAIYAVYPYRYSSYTWHYNYPEGYEDNKEYGMLYGTMILTDGTLRVILPQEQPYTPGHRVCPTANLMVAVTSSSKDKNLAFKNACGYLSVPVSGTARVKRVTLRSNSGEALSGPFTVQAEYGKDPELSVYDGYAIYADGARASQEISLIPQQAVQLSPDRQTEFCFVVPPVTLEKGFTVVFDTEDLPGVTFETHTSRTIERNKTYTMDPVVVNKSEYTLFKDPITGSSTLYFRGLWLNNNIVEANMKYKEVDGVRYCTVSPLRGSSGIWGDVAGCTFDFIWHTEQYDNFGCQVLDVPFQYMGWDYSGWESRLLEDATYPLYASDEYYIYTTYYKYTESADEFYSNNATCRRSYYDPVSAKFSFTLYPFLPTYGNGAGFGASEDAAILCSPMYRDYRMISINGKDGYPGNNSITVTVGENVRYLKYFLNPGINTEQEIESLAESIARGELLTETVTSFSVSGTIKTAQIDPGVLDAGDYTVIVVGFNENDEACGHLSCSLTVIEKQGANWSYLGTGLYTDDFIGPLFNLESLTWEVPVMQDLNDASHYKMVYPYDDKYPYNEEGDWDTSQDYDIEFYIPDANHVYFYSQMTGVNWGEYGMISISSIVGSYLEDGYTLEELYEMDVKFGKLEDGVITFPKNALLVALANYNGGGFMYANNSGLFKLVMPGQ